MNKISRLLVCMARMKKSKVFGQCHAYIRLVPSDLDNDVIVPTLSYEGHDLNGYSSNTWMWGHLDACFGRRIGRS